MQRKEGGCNPDCEVRSWTYPFYLLLADRPCSYGIYPNEQVIRRLLTFGTIFGVLSSDILRFTRETGSCEVEQTFATCSVTHHWPLGIVVDPHSLLHELLCTIVHACGFRCFYGSRTWIDAGMNYSPQGNHPILTHYVDRIRSQIGRLSSIIWQFLIKELVKCIPSGMKRSGFDVYRIGIYELNTCEKSPPDRHMKLITKLFMFSIEKWAVSVKNNASYSLITLLSCIVNDAVSMWNYTENVWIHLFRLKVCTVRTIRDHRAHKTFSFAHWVLLVVLSASIRDIEGIRSDIECKSLSSTSPLLHSYLFCWSMSSMYMLRHIIYWIIRRSYSRTSYSRNRMWWRMMRECSRSTPHIAHFVVFEVFRCTVSQGMQELMQCNEGLSYSGESLRHTNRSGLTLEMEWWLAWHRDSARWVSQWIS